VLRVWFKKNRFRVRIEDGSISAEKGYLRETGNLLFHLSLILILVGVSFGSLFGMRGEAIVNVGERFINVPTSFDTLSFGKLKNENALIHSRSKSIDLKRSTTQRQTHLRITQLG
jgi:cytochrome c biogenesis protein